MCGRLICTQLIPHAVDFFTGKALEYEALDEDDEDLDLGDDDDASDEGVSSHISGYKTRLTLAVILVGLGFG